MPRKSQEQLDSGDNQEGQGERIVEAESSGPSPEDVRDLCRILQAKRERMSSVSDSLRDIGYELYTSPATERKKGEGYELREQADKLADTLKNEAVGVRFDYERRLEDLEKSTEGKSEEYQKRVKAVLEEFEGDRLK